MFHGPQLKNIGFDLSNPQSIEKLYTKLSNEIFDFGNYAQILDNQEDSRFE
jgi:hypothetical protein